MARISTLPAAIKARIEDIDGLGGCAVIFKSASIEAEFETRMKKVSGTAIIIRVTNGQNEASGKKSAFTCTVTISIFVLPLLKRKDCETVLTEVESALHGWWPDSVMPNNAYYLKSTGFSFPENNIYDIAVLSLKTPATPLI